MHGHTGMPTRGYQRPDHLRVLLEPLDGLELDAEQHEVLDWLASWDCPTVEAVADLLWTARAAGKNDR